MNTTLRTKCRLRKLLNMQTTIDRWSEKVDKPRNIDQMRDDVLKWMGSQPFFSRIELESLRQVELGLLRRNSTQKHGVCRYLPGTDVSRDGLGPVDVKRIDIHPGLLDEEWYDYGLKVLYHEYIHALGHFHHDAEFKALERRWNGVEKDRGLRFTEAMRLANATWIWRCPGCASEFPRRKPGRGGYRCIQCDEVLIDHRIED